QEAFADLMKLRDRLNKVERVLTSYKTLKGSPFQEFGTSVRVPELEKELMPRITFETKVRENDILEARFRAATENPTIHWGILFLLLELVTKQI
ncbi:ATP-dependent helicase/nuclease subunit A, partial [Bienertia sinuspersici]